MTGSQLGATSRVSPFVFVAATRYAILRTLTSASEEIADQVIAHADLIKAEPGASWAIRQEIDDALPRMREPQGFGQSQHEADRIARRWQRAAEALA